jgi:hypothetical protein
VNEWDGVGAWPDGWHRWNIALGDAVGWSRGDLTDLANLSSGQYADLKGRLIEERAERGRW